MSIWEKLESAEQTAGEQLKKDLAEFEGPIQKCVEAGIKAPTLCEVRPQGLRFTFSAMFLKRILNDLRCVWLLLNKGYTAQASSIAASLYENSLAIMCMCENEERAKKLAQDDSGEFPWKPKKMCQLIAEDRKLYLERGKIQKQDETDEFTDWKRLYSRYVWLCQIKHPTLLYATYDIGSTAVKGVGYHLMPSPDLREEDLGIKKLICIWAINDSIDAIDAFAQALNVKSETDEERHYGKLRTDTRMFLLQQVRSLKTEGNFKIPFAINHTRWFKDDRKAKH